MKQSSALKMCPFCLGEQFRFEFHRPVMAEPHHTFIICCKCGVYGPSAKDRESAMRAWNHRPLMNKLEEQHAQTVRNLRDTIEQAETAVALWREKAESLARAVMSDQMGKA